jgi:hypothetical protein
MGATTRAAALNGQQWIGGIYPPGDARLHWADDIIRRAIGAYGCELWVDASDIDQPSGSDVQMWPARYGIDPAQPISSKRPEYSADGWNGRPCVLFDNVGEALTCSVDLSTTPSATLIISAQTNAAAAAAVVFEYGQNVISDRGILMYFNSLKPYVMSAQNGVPSRQEGADTVEDRRVVVGGVFDSSTTPDVSQLWKADAPFVGRVTNLLADVNTSEPTTNYAANTAWLGSRNDGAVLPLDGSVREVLLIPARVPEDVMRLLMHALAIKGDVA